MKNATGTKVGLWIDHKEAFVVTITGDEKETRTILSDVEKNLERTGDSPLAGRYESQNVPTDGHRQSALTAHLNLYYDKVIACIGAADSIVIFGPGEAKGQLRQRMERSDLAGRIVGVETADRMTPSQLAAAVREHLPK